MKTLGYYPALTPEQARLLHGQFRAQATLGVDLSEKIKKESAKSKTFGDALDHYIERHLPSKRPVSVATDRANIDKYLRPRFGKSELASITGADIARFMHDLREKPVQANRLIALISKVFSLAVFEKFCEENPCKGIKKYPEHHRERLLSAEEGLRLRAALDAFAASDIDAESIDMMRLILFTGARKGEVFAATWSQFDLQSRIWTKPASTTKQKRLHRVPLAAPAVALLTEIRERNRGKCDGLVFSRSAEGKRTAFKRLWPKICAEAGLEDLRVHDLRHSFAATLLSAGRSLPAVGKLLGHSQAQTTKNTNI